MHNINNLSDYERGEYDCVHGHLARECESGEYYTGYADAYEKEQSATWYSEQQFNQIMGEKYD
jgi:hypothetical protein